MPEFDSIEETALGVRKLMLEEAKELYGDTRVSMSEGVCNDRIINRLVYYASLLKVK